MKMSCLLDDPVQYDLEEGWKDWVAGATMGVAAMGVGSAGQVPQQKQQQPVVQQVQKAQQKTPQTDTSEITQVILKPEAKVLIKAAKSIGMKGAELAQFIAQCAHETADFKFMKELGNALKFRKYDNSKALGNVRPGDGAKYSGRGYIQLTGRGNYKRAGEALGLPLEQRPELVENPEVAAKVAVWFWKEHVQPKVDNFNNTAQVTKPINGGLRGLQDRHNKFAAIMQLMRKS